HNALTSNGGKAIVFESDADPLGNNITGNQVYLYDGKAGLTSALSHGSGFARNPTLSRDGGRILFESDEPLVGPRKPPQVFLYRRSGSRTAQITSAPAGGACTNPSVSSEGGTLTFISADNLLNQVGSTGPELYLYNINKGILALLTDAPAALPSGAHS